MYVFIYSCSLQLSPRTFLNDFSDLRAYDIGHDFIGFVFRRIVFVRIGSEQGFYFVVDFSYVILMLCEPSEAGFVSKLSTILKRRLAILL